MKMFADLNAALELRLLGDFQIRYQGQPLEHIHQPRLQSLLAYLVLHRDTPQARQQLSFLFWPDTTEQQARTNLRNLLFQLRKELPNAEGFLQINRHSVQWCGDASFSVDVAEFEDIVQQAEELLGDADRIKTQLVRAVALYKGDLLPTLYDDWIFPEQERLRIRYQQVLERLVALLEGRREYEEAITYAQLLLNHDPLREESYRSLMRLHAYNDDHGSIARVYHNCVTILRRELAVEPAFATQALFAQLRQKKQSTIPLTQSSPPSAVERSAIPLIGRCVAWQQLQMAWRRSIHSYTQVVLLTGETGMGKTRLAEEMVRWAQRQGIITAMAACFASEAHCAFAPLVRLLRQPPVTQVLESLDTPRRNELLSWLPELRTGQLEWAQPIIPFTEWQRTRLFEALSYLLMQIRQPLLLVLDNLQWCDTETLDWSRHLLRYVGETRDKSMHRRYSRPGLFVVGTANSEDYGDEDPLTAWRFALQQRQQITEIELQPLNRCEIARLATATLDLPLDDELVDELYCQSEGVPFYMIEMLKVRFPTGSSAPNASEAAGESVLPVSIRSLLEARLYHLSATARDVLALAALVGKKFTFEQLVPASSLDQDQLIEALDEALQHRLVAEEYAGCYAFRHNLIRTVAQGRLSQTRRRVLERRLQEALQRQ